MKKAVFLFVALITMLLLAGAVYRLPPVHDRLAWRVEEVRAQVKYALDPPEEAVFIPQEPLPQEIVQQAALLAPASPTPTLTPTASPEPQAARLGPTSSPEPSATAQPSPTPLPEKVTLKGVKHEFQKWNNCGPATLSMALSFWGWSGDQLDVAEVVKPNQRDKNVMPYEMASFVEEATDYRALVRVGGELETIKAFLSAGLPVVVEKGFEGANFDGWMGHYEVVTGYDDSKEQFIAQDSYIKANLTISYDDLEANWRAFNYLYMVIFPPEREAEVLSILGPDADETENWRRAAQRASDEIYALSGRDQYFAWFNRGTSLMNLQDYTGAAAAYDQAFALYPSIPLDKRPYRMLWYQTGPYFAYFFTQRFYDTISLATTTIDASSEPAIEESFYWRARAFYELYLLEGKADYLEHAIEDYRASLKWHPDFGPTLNALEMIGVQP